MGQAISTLEMAVYLIVASKGSMSSSEQADTFPLLSKLLRTLMNSMNVTKSSLIKVATFNSH
jgi:hypothetical protein